MLHTVSNLELLGALALVLGTGALLYVIGRVHGHDRGYASAMDDVSTCADELPPPAPAPAEDHTVPLRVQPRAVYDSGYGVRRVGYSAILPNGHANPCLCGGCCGMYGIPTPR